MWFDGHKQAVINTDSKGGARITIRVPEESENDLVFFYQLRFADKDRSKEQTYKGYNLERYVFETMVDNTITFSVHVPISGQYFMEVFANKIDNGGRVEDDNANIAPFKLKCACKFKIVCESLSGTMHPLPNCAPGEWGPKKAQRHFGIVPVILPASEFEMEKAGMLTVEDNFELKFQTPQPYQFVAKLRMNGVESKILDPYVNLSSEGSVLTVSVSLPQPGQYGLDIFARPKGAETATLSHACKYLINCTKVSSCIDLPKSLPLSGNKRASCGPTSGFDEMGLQIISQKEAKIILEKTNTTSFEVKIPTDVVLSYQFLREPDEDNRDYVFQTCEPNGIIRFTISLPKKGNYMLSLYARKNNSNSRSAPNVYNCLIQYTPDSAEDQTDTNGSSATFKRSVFKKSDSKDRSSVDKSSEKSV